MLVEMVNPATDPRWDEQVLATPNYSFFHSSQWAKVLAGTYKFKPRYFMLSEGGYVRALLPVMEIRTLLTGRRGVSLPFTDHCEPLVDRELFPSLLAQLIDFGRRSGWQKIGIRGGGSLLPDTPPAASYLMHTLDLSTDGETLFSKFRDSTRRNITRAINQGVEVKVCSSMEAVRDYYRLHCLTRKRHGVPPQPFLFFRNIHEHVLAKDHGMVLIASYGGRTVAGALCCHFGTKALYKFGASDFSSQHLRANNLVMWEAVRWFADGGYTSFCFGRTDCQNEGLRQFKRGWGATETTVNYYQFDQEGRAVAGTGDVRGSRFVPLFRHLPAPVLQLIGNALYRHMG